MPTAGTDPPAFWRAARSLESTLACVMCHGDTHVFNNHVRALDADEAPRTLFDLWTTLAEGCAAYDPCVWLCEAEPARATAPWSRQKPCCQRWQQYLAGYRTVGAAMSPDVSTSNRLAALCAVCGTCEHGEGVARIHQGANMMSTDWIKKQP